MKLNLMLSITALFLAACAHEPKNVSTERQPAADELPPALSAELDTKILASAIFVAAYRPQDLAMAEKLSDRALFHIEVIKRDPSFQSTVSVSGPPLAFVGFLVNQNMRDFYKVHPVVGLKGLFRKYVGAASFLSGGSSAVYTMSTFGEDNREGDEIRKTRLKSNDLDLYVNSVAHTIGPVFNLSAEQKGQFRAAYHKTMVQLPQGQSADPLVVLTGLNIVDPRKIEALRWIEAKRPVTEESSVYAERITALVGLTALLEAYVDMAKEHVLPQPVIDQMRWTVQANKDALERLRR